ncbi:MAG: hypothetical protein ACI8Y4_002872 [Candidatus Poriferisodalaceae bacterium]
MVAAALRPGGGHWPVDRNGVVVPHKGAGIFSVVDPGAGWLETQRPVLAADEDVTSLSATSTGDGFWLFTTLGRTIAYGDAQHFGDTSGVVLVGRVIGSAVTPTDGVFNFGTSPFHGSLGASPPPVDVATVVVLDHTTGFSETGYIMFDRYGIAYPFGSGFGYLAAG